MQGIELDRNAWHALDGNGKGNREGIAIEICYSKSGGERWLKAHENAAELTAKLLKDYGWGITGLPNIRTTAASIVPTEYSTSTVGIISLHL